FDAGVFEFVFSPDGKLLAVAEEAEEAKPARLTLWNVNTARKVAELPGQQGKAYGLTFSADGNLLAAYGDPRIARVWAVRGRKLVHTFSKHQQIGVVFPPKGKTTAVELT